MADDNKRKYLFDEFSDDYGEGPYSGYDYSLPEDFNLDIGSLGSNAELGLNFDWGSLTNLVADPNLFAAFAEANPEDAALLKDLAGGDYGFAPVGGGSPADAASGVYDPNDQSAAETARLQRQTELTASGQNAVANIGPQGDTGVQSQSADKTGITKLIDDVKNAVTDITGLDAGDAAKYAALLAMARMAYNDAQEARREARGASVGKNAPVTATRTAYKGTKYSAAGGGIGSLEMARGGRTLPPRYLNGHSDGMADKVPAHIDNKRPAALSDGEFVIPADVVSHLGNGNSNAGAKRLYEMMDRIRAARTGNSKQGRQINPDKFMPR